MILKVPVKFHGKYEFTLTHGDGSVQKTTVHNIATSNIVSTITKSTLCVGSGSGTPASTDTKLFTHLWQFNADNISEVQNIDNDGARIRLTYTIPATTDYVATITEVGMGPSDAIYTHAMLSDAEGNPISIIKTENDRLTIVVTLELFASTMLTLTKKFASFASIDLMPNLSAFLLARLISGNRYHRVLRGYASNLGYVNDRLSMAPRNIMLPYRETEVGYVNTIYDKGINPPYASWEADKTLMQMTLHNNLRCKTDAFNTHYYRYLQLSWGLQYDRNTISSGATYLMMDIPYALDLKNPEIFPPQLITGITVATGDGVTADFACPMNYFQEGTDVIYKNGVALTRDVDYTIEYNANKDKLPELMYIQYTDAAQEAIKITSDDSLWTSGTHLQFLPENNIARNSHITYDTSRVCTAFNDTHPLHFDWGAARKCNCLRGYLYRYYTGTLHVEYSTDNEAWKEVASLSISSEKNTEANIELTWDTVEARYWRIRITRYGTSSSKTTLAYFKPGGYESFLGYTNPLGIRFTIPPAENDVITMDCYTDIPFKNSNFVFNLALALTLQFS